MSEAQPNIDEIFLTALDKRSPEERAQYLDQVCLGNGTLRQWVERLLEAHPQAANFMESPAADVTATISLTKITEGPGAMIGPYKLLQKIGEGGMGAVSMAEQMRPVERRVASE